MMKYTFAVLMILFGVETAHACNVPNPNLLAGDGVHQWVDGCSAPAVALNKLASNVLLRVLQTADTAWQTLFGTATTGVVASHGGLNNFVAYELNDQAPATANLPVALTGFGKVASGSTGDIVFGIYGLGQLSATSGVAVGEELTVTNNGAAPDITLPPNTGFGTPSAVANGEQITCDNAGSFDCSIGLYISNNLSSYAGRSFNTGEYITMYRQYGLFIDLQSSGTQTGAVIRSNGNGIVEQLQYLNVNPLNSVLTLTDGTTVHFNVTQNGNISNTGSFASTGKLEFSQAARPTLASNCNGAGSSINKSTDQAGTVTTPTAGATSGACTVTFATAFLNIPSCVVSLEGASGAFISAHSATAITIGGLSSSTTQNVDYHCIDQN